MDKTNFSAVSAFPAFAVDERVLSFDYPNDAVRSNYKLPARDLAKTLNVGDRYQLQIVQVTNPHSFHFWMYDDDYDSYATMSWNLDETYKSIVSTTLTIPRSLQTPGHLCVVRSNKSSKWERAQVVGYQTDNARNHIEVKLIDMGVMDTICPMNVKFLMKQFATMPPQCMHGRLAYVTPFKGLRWSSDAVDTFIQLGSYSRLFAKLVAIKDNIAHVMLVNPDNVHLTRSLIDSGLVRRCLQT